MQTRLFSAHFHNVLKAGDDWSFWEIVEAARDWKKVHGDAFSRDPSRGGES
jgi:hypothetical protein